MTELPLTLSRADSVGVDVEPDLIERAKSDPQAFAVLYRQYYAAIAGYVHRRVGDVHATEDLAAEVFMTVMRSLPRYRDRGIPIRAWLYRIATNTVNRWIRRRRRQILKHLSYRIAAGSDRTSRSNDSDIDAEWTRCALQSLPLKFQAAVSLHYLEGMSVEDVAAVIGCPTGTVKSRLARGREALRSKLLQGR